MEPFNSPFHEYILLRARVIVYVAGLLFVFALVGVLFLALSGASNLNRMGLLLQLLGVLALLPDIIGKDRFRAAGFGQAQPAPGPKTGATVVDHPVAAAPSAHEPGAPRPGQARQGSTQTQPAQQPAGPSQPIPPTGGPAAQAPAVFAYIDDYHAYNPLLLLGNILASLAAMGWLAVLVFAPPAEIFPEDRLIRIGLGVLGFAWLNLYMLIQIFRLFGAPLPGLMLTGFLILDFPVSLIGVGFAAAAHILVRWLGQGLRFAFRTGIRRVLLTLTLPCLVLGLLLELIATFLP